MNLRIALGILLLVIASIFGVSSFKKSMTPYLSFSEARRATGLVQVNGVLASKNYLLKADEQYLEFDLRDSHGQIMKVEYRGVIPGNFDQATSIVAIGHYANGRFLAEQLLVKCPSKYQTESERRRLAT
jgi:cytochrome c-type biogenesis protein CcmE